MPQSAARLSSTMTPSTPFRQALGGQALPWFAFLGLAV
jgi:hypothetical protein